MTDIVERALLEELERQCVAVDPAPKGCIDKAAVQLRGVVSIAGLARAAYEVMARSDGELREALNGIHEARLRNGEDVGYGWNITKLNRAMNAALPLLGKEVPAPLNLSDDEIEALRTLSGSSGHEG